MKILVAAAHPDDETLGLGATLAKYAADGHETYVCIFADGVRGRKEDHSSEVLDKQKIAAEKACKSLGVKEVFFLGFNDQKLDSYAQLDLNKKFEEVVRKLKPEVVYTHHHGDVNTDHRKVCETTLVATRPFSCTVRRVLSYEVPSSTEWNVPGREVFAPSVYENIEKFFDKKIQALQCYTKTHTNELRKFPYPRSVEAVEALAKKRGSESGFKRAEAFCLIREKRE